MGRCRYRYIEVAESVLPGPSKFHYNNNNRNTYQRCSSKSLHIFFFHFLIFIFPRKRFHWWVFYSRPHVAVPTLYCFGFGFISFISYSIWFRSTFTIICHLDGTSRRSLFAYRGGDRLGSERQ